MRIIGTGTTTIIVTITVWKAPLAALPWNRSACARSKTRRCHAMLSQGVPMLLMGDECRRTQNGNNNAYCRDDGFSWASWGALENTTASGAFVGA